MKERLQKLLSAAGICSRVTQIRVCPSRTAADTRVRPAFSVNPVFIRLIASTTKLMTALVAVERAGDLDETVTVKGEWLGSEGSPPSASSQKVTPIRI